MTVEIGELRARLVAEATQMKQEIATVKKGITDLGEESKKTSTALGGVSTALDDLGKSKGMDELPSALDNLNARIDLQRKKLAQLKESFDSTFNEAKKNQLQEQILKTEATIISMIASSDQMAQKMAETDNGLTAAGEAAKQSDVSFNALNSTLRQLGLSSEQIKKINQEMKDANPHIVQQQFEQLEAQLNAMGVDGKQALSLIKQEMEQVGLESQQVVSEVITLDQSLKEIGLNAEQIKVVERHLSNLDPTKADRQLEELSTTLKKLGVDSQSIEKINQELRETEVEAGKAKQGINGLASGIAALGAGAALNKLVNTVKTLSSEANDLSNSYRGLGNVAKSFNVDASAAANLADELADRWGLNKAVMADTVKTYTTLNLTLEETEEIITATADAAAYGRQSHLAWDEAIKKVAEGIKAGNSNLTDSAGITTNLSVMQERYAKSIGTTVGKLTEAQKIQAAYNGMLEEGAVFAGNADDAMTGLTGTQATYQSTLEEARTELGEAFIPSVQRLLELVTPLIRDFALWSSANKDTVVGLTAAAVAVTALIAVVGALTAAIALLNTAMGPIGWAILGISALATGVTAYAVASNQASDAVREFTANQEQLNQALRDSPANLTANQYKMLQSNMETLNEVLERRIALEKEAAEIQQLGEEGLGSPELAARLFEIGDALKKIDKELKAMDYSSVEEAEFALIGMKKASDEALGAKVAMTRESMRENIALADNVTELKNLSREYDELNGKASLTEQQKNRLAEVTKKLKQEYPDLITLLDEENRWHIKNKDALDEFIIAEETRVEKLIEGSKIAIQAAKIEAQEKVRLAREALNEIERLEGREGPLTVAPFLNESLGSFLSQQTESMFDREKRKLIDEISQGNYDINEAAKLLDDLSIGNFDAFRTRTVTDPEEEKKKKKSGRVKTKAELQMEEYQEALRFIEYKKNLNQMSEEQELASLQKLEQKYKENAEIRKDAEVRVYQLKDQIYKKEYSEALKLINYKRELGQMSEKHELARLESMQQKYKGNKDLQEELELKIYKLKEQLAQKDFQNSNDWINQEERRMTLAGESEEAIAQMKLEAWSRVRSRYDKDSDYYKQADIQLYNLRVNIIKQQVKAEQDAAKERETLLKDTTKQALDAIDKAKKAELDALSDRRKAIQKFYDDQAEIIDDSERLKERNELEAEMDKYRYATSEKGQKHYLELVEKLRKMDVEQQKRELNEQRDQELEALDKQKQDIEDYYNELREATSDLTGDLTALYKLADDERLKSFVKTNELIKQEMVNLQQALAASQAAAASSTAGVTQSIIAQMQANSLAWHSADAAGKKRLEADNQSLGSDLGATYKNGSWYKDGFPLYHTGGIAGEMNFRSGNDLMPDEITAILKRGEPVLTPQQVSSLVKADSGTKVHIENMVGVQMNDVVVEDEIDLRTYERTGGNEAAEILRKQLTGGG